MGCYAGLREESGGESWYTFSKDGGFTESRKLIGVTNFRRPPDDGRCFEMVVRYEKEQNYCYYIRNLPQPSGTCSGWWQLTREFYLVDKDASRLIPKDEWRRDYRDKYAQ